MAGRQRLLAAVGGALAVCMLAGPAAGALGAKASGTPSAKHMKMRFTPKRGPAGTTFTGIARGFSRGEPVAARELGRSRRASRLPGGTALPDGRVRVLRRTFATSKPGPRRLCLRGERSRKVACGRYRVTRGADPDEEPSLDEGSELSPDREGEQGPLEFIGNDDLLDLDEDLEDQLDLPG